MENVYIPEELLTTIKVKRKAEGDWIKGVWVEGEEQINSIEAAYMPISPSTLKKYPAGSITLENMSLFTKENLELKDKVLIEDAEWNIYQRTSYSYLADMKFYILRRSNKDD